MSGVLDLRSADRLWRGGAEMGEVWLGGQRLWKKPDPLAPYYGVGVGQISLHLPLGVDAHRTWDPNGILTVKNIAVEAEALNCTTTLGEQPARLPNGVDFALAPTDGALFRALRLGTSINLSGAHLLIPIRWTGSQQYLCGTLSGASLSLIPGAAGKARVRAESGGYYDSADFALTANTWALIEVRIATAATRVWCNGLLVSDTAKGRASLPMSIIGTGYGPQYAGMYRCVSQMGVGLIAVKTGGDQATIWPSIIKTRAVLAAAHGITLV